MKVIPIFLLCFLLTGCVKVDVYHSVSVNAMCDDVSVLLDVE